MALRRELFGWAPIGPHRGGYAYGQPLSYDPPVAEAWVFVAPRYLTSRTIYRYALPPSDLGRAFVGAPTVYRPEFRNGAIFNFGFPRDRASRFGGGPIVGMTIYRMDRKGGRYGKFEGGGDGIRVFAPGFQKGVKPNRAPKNFVKSPSDFKPKAKLKRTFEGKPPKGWGPGAVEVESINKEGGSQGFKPKQGPGRDKDQGNAAQGGPSDGGAPVDQGSQNDKDKGKDKRKSFGAGNGPNGDQGGGNAQGGVTPGTPTGSDQGGGGQDKNKDKKKKKKNQDQGGGEGSGAPKQGGQQQSPPPGVNGEHQGGWGGVQKSQGGGQGGGGQGGGNGDKDKGKNKNKNKKNKDEKCRNNPNQEGCQQQSN
jgi:hypothetical protein